MRYIWSVCCISASFLLAGTASAQDSVLVAVPYCLSRYSPKVAIDCKFFGTPSLGRVVNDNGIAVEVPSKSLLDKQLKFEQDRAAAAEAELKKQISDLKGEVESLRSQVLQMKAGK